MKNEHENILEEEVKQDKKIKSKIFTPKIKTLTCFSLACVLLVGGSFAYFSDYAQTTVEGTTGTVRIGVDNNINLLNTEGKDILNPGDARDVSFTVNNEGNKSVDTEIMITLTSSVPMSDNYRDSGIDSLSLYGMEPYGLDGETVEPLNYGDVYSSEYELYYADDIAKYEGYGYSTKEGVSPVKKRYMNYAMDKIVYVLDGAVLSGNEDFDEREIEWIHYHDFSQYEMKFLNNIDDYYYFDYIDVNDLGKVCVVSPYYNTNLTIVIPDTGSTAGAGEKTTEYVYINALVRSTNAKNLCVPRTIKGYLYEDGDEQIIYSAEEIKTLYGLEVTYYDNFDMFFSTGDVIKNSEYMNLSETEKADYVKCPDSKTYNFKLLFDPNSNNDFQASNVTIEVEVRAKQHRNTSAGWELVDTMLESVIQDSIFIVDYDNMHRVELTGVKDGVDFSSMTEISIPEGVEVVPESFFEGCTNIETVNLPSTLEEISYAAFEGCTSLTEVNLPADLESIGGYAFADCTSLSAIDIPDSVKYIGGYAFTNCTSLGSVEIPEGITCLYEGTFNGCTGLESISLPSTLKTIEDYQFTGCSSLKTIVLPNGLEGLGYGTFEDCISLNNVDIPDSVKYFDYSTFEGCINLTNVTLPSTLTKIPDTMFMGCTALTSIDIPETVTQIGYGSFEGCTGLTSFVIPEGITYIGARAFYGCDNLTEITLPDSLNYISNKAFYCNKVVSTTIYTNNDVVDDYNWTGSLRNITVLPIE